MRDAEENANEFAKRVIPLLKEFSEQFREKQRTVMALQDQFFKIPDDERRSSEVAITLRDRLQALNGSIRSLDGAANRTSQQVSQRLSHSEMDEVYKTILALRLAEFDAERFAANSLASNINL